MAGPRRSPPAVVAWEVHALHAMRRVRAWFVCAFGLSVIDGLARLTYTGRRYVGRPPLAWFDATDEWTVPTCFSVVTMGAIAVVCWRRVGAARWCWRLLGGLFAYLAIDDLLGLHEAIGAAVHPWFAGAGVYSWVLVMAPVLAALAGACAVRLWPELARQPGRCAWLVLGFAALAGALGIEAAENVVGTSAVRLRGLRLIDYAQWLEETLELLGPVFLLAAVLPERDIAAVTSTACSDARSPRAWRG